jgi:hypothetical protein
MCHKKRKKNERDEGFFDALLLAYAFGQNSVPAEGKE